jgi:hypothetical protein
MKSWNEAEDVFITDTISNADMEIWMKEVRKMSEQEVDFYNSMGRTGIHTLGDVSRVKLALRETRKIHDSAYVKAILKIIPKMSFDTIKQQLNGLWSLNGFKY